MTNRIAPTEALVQTTPRPHPDRSRRETYPVIGQAKARYGDMDANGHINNLAIEALHEDARATFNAQAFPGIYATTTRQVRLVSSQNVVHFMAEAHWPAVFETGVGVGRIGNTSFVACSAIFEGSVCVSICDTVLVALDDSGPVPIPDDVRATLSGFTLHHRER